MTDTTARLTLPLLDAGQAQKEVTHNEALALLDIAVQASVVAIGLTVPPAAPAVGQSWIVGDAPSGEWTGYAHAIAGWTGGGWRFVPPCEGMVAWSLADGVAARFVGGAWTVGIAAVRQLTVAGLPVVGARQGAIAAANGGTTVDVEARAVISMILEALRDHGLIAA